MWKLPLLGVLLLIATFCLALPPLGGAMLHAMLD
jgi:hypothetical protein